MFKNKRYFTIFSQKVNNYVDNYVENVYKGQRFMSLMSILLAIYVSRET